MISRLTTLQLIFAYTFGFAVFILVPIPLSDTHTFEGLSIGDLVDAPLVLLPIGLLFLMALDADLWRTPGLRIALLLALLLLVQGHAIHLAANAIAHSLEEQDAAWQPAYFLDEHWGHYELDGALLGLAVLFVSFAKPTESHFDTWLIVAIVGYGALLAAAAIEGQTVPLMLPASAVLTLAGWKRVTQRSGAYATFFSGSYAVCLLVLVVYGAKNGGWPQIL